MVTGLLVATVTPFVETVLISTTNVLLPSTMVFVFGVTSNVPLPAVTVNDPLACVKLLAPLVILQYNVAPFGILVVVTTNGAVAPSLSCVGAVVIA